MRRLWPALLALVASPAFAQERDYCPDRPSLGTSACIIDRGHVSVESAVIDWTLDRQPDSRTDTLLIGRTMVRVGATDTIEARVGWTPYGHERTRDLESGAVERLARVGDVSLAIKASLAHPDGKGLAVAVLPYVTLPVGRAPIGGGGALGAGLLLPLSYDLSDTVQLVATPSIAARPNEDGPGRHGRYSTTGGATVKLTEAVSVSAEAQVIRDDEPGDRTTQALGALSIAWQPQDDWQLDLFGVAGLNRDAPDVELAMGVSRRF